MENKLWKWTDNTYKLSLILLIIQQIVMIFGLYILKEFDIILYSGIILFVFFLDVLVFVILGIISFIKIKDYVIRKKLITKFIILFILTFLTLGLQLPEKVAGYIDNKNKIRAEEKYINMIEQLIDGVKSDKENRYIYDVDELNNLVPEIDLSEYDDSSHITYFEGKAYVCFSKTNDDNSLKIEGYQDDFKFSYSSFLNSPCSNYEVNRTEAEIYMTEYYKNNYGDKIFIEKFDYIDDCDYFLFGARCPEYRRFNVNTPVGSFVSKIEVIGNQIVLTDGYDDYLNSLTDNDKLLIAIRNFSKNYSTIDNYYGLITAKQYNDEYDYTVIQVDYSEGEAKNYAEALANYLAREGHNGNIVVGKFIRVSSDNCSDFLCIENNIKFEYTIAFTVENGNVIWKGIDN